ncbi:MAG: HAMP domain-containing protein, partial [Xanthomonadales bacterium]|nr:HAMP domain-containing protein [Xanthomonadales bacterium]
QALQTLPGGSEIAALVRARGTDVGLVPADTEAVQAALRGESGVLTYRDGFGQTLLGAYGPLQLSDGTRWAVISRIAADEALAPVTALLRQQSLVAAGIALVLAMLAGLIANRLARSINQPVSQLSATVQQLSAGNMEARAELAQQDELGDLGRALDNLLDERVATLTKAAAENEQLNDSVIQIMQAVTGLAQNDLTVTVPVTPDITGAVSDAINLLTKETSDALRKVLQASNEVTEASNTLRSRTEVVHYSANANDREVQAAATELKQAAEALATVAAQAEGARSRAEEALRTSTQGLRIVSETVQGVTASRDQIRETEKRVKRLAERSQEITGVVNIINQIAERTAVLALNAGMQAAAAGDAGRGFAVVADEVKRLADSARTATAQIGTLVGGIQADAADTMRAMNDSLSQFVDITRLAERAGEQVQASMSATDGLATAVRDIAESSSRQARISGTLVERAQRMDATTRQTLDELSRQRDNVQVLLEQSQSLLSTVGVFRLPGSSRGA